MIASKVVRTAKSHDNNFTATFRLEIVEVTAHGIVGGKHRFKRYDPPMRIVDRMPDGEPVWGLIR